MEIGTWQKSLNCINAYEICSSLKQSCSGVNAAGNSVQRCIPRWYSTYTYAHIHAFSLTFHILFNISYISSSIYFSHLAGFKGISLNSNFGIIEWISFLRFPFAFHLLCSAPLVATSLDFHLCHLIFLCTSDATTIKARTTNVSNLISVAIRMRIVQLQYKNRKINCNN